VKIYGYVKDIYGNPVYGTDGAHNQTLVAIFQAIPHEEVLACGCTDEQGYFEFWVPRTAKYCILVKAPFTKEVHLDEVKVLIQTLINPLKTYVEPIDSQIQVNFTLDPEEFYGLGYMMPKEKGLTLRKYSPGIPSGG
jgi:hypothetical protein